MSPIINSSDTPFTVGVALDGCGAHPAAWREAGADPGSLFSADHWWAQIAALEAAGVDYASVEDALIPQLPVIGEQPSSRLQERRTAGRLDALLLLSWLAPRTSRIGLIPTVTTTHTEPFHVATALQTLDHISDGRAGWQLRVSPTAAEAAAFGRREAPVIDVDAVVAGRTDSGLNELLDEAADVAEIASRLWDSWEDGAIIRDIATGRFLDADRVHPIDFEGERFSIAGPSIVPRSPQGRPPITLLAHSGAVYRLAARAADVVFVTPEPQSKLGGASYGHGAERIVAAVRSAEAETGRSNRDPLRIVADIVVALDEANGTEGAETGADRLARLDAVGPELRSDARVVTGTAQQVADVIEAWRAAGIEGIRIRPLAQPRDVRAISEDLLPELRRRGLASAPADPLARPSLRERFGLSAAANRYASGSAGRADLQGVAA